MTRTQPAPGDPVQSGEDGLHRRLTTSDAVGLVAGTVIGSAVFLVPATVLAAHPSPTAAAIVFFVAGLVSCFGALAYAELASMFPATGGDYVYLRESWGPAAGFLCGWSYFIVIQTGGIAALAVGFAALVSSVAPLGPISFRACSIGLLVALTAVNHLGIRTGASTNNALVVLKLSGLVTMLVAVTLWSEPVPIDWSWPADWTPRHFGLAIVPVLWAYEGWNVVTFVGGEMRTPRRSIPNAVVMGLGLVMLVYMASLWVYLRVLPVAEIAASQAVAPAAAIRVLGQTGGTLVTLTMIAALAGSANSSILAAPRIYFAQARDGLFFESFSRLSTRFRTPVRALWTQCALASFFSISGSYELLLSWCTFTAWLFYALCVGSVILLRHGQPDRPRAFRMPGYPWTALLFLFTAGAFIAGTIWTRPLTSIAGVAVTAAGLPLYFYWRRNAAAKKPSPG